MTILTKFFAGVVLAFGLLSVSNAASIPPTTDGFKVYQSDTDETTEDEEKKKKEGEEEEEPDC